MGVAAYNRGSACLAREIRADQPTHEQLFFADLTELSKSAKYRMFPIDTGIRQDRQGIWWIMNRLDSGFAEYGIPFKTLRELAKTYRLAFFGWTFDKHGKYIAVTSY